MCAGTAGALCSRPDKRATSLATRPFRKQDRSAAAAAVVAAAAVPAEATGLRSRPTLAVSFGAERGEMFLHQSRCAATTAFAYAYAHVRTRSPTPTPVRMHMSMPTWDGTHQ